MQEETGIEPDTAGLRTSAFVELNPARQKSGKVVFVWAAEGDFNTSQVRSNTFEMEWPPKSGRNASFPEIDKGEWFKINEAKERIVPSQLLFIIELEYLLKKAGKL